MILSQFVLRPKYFGLGELLAPALNTFVHKQLFSVDAEPTHIYQQNEIVWYRDLQGPFVMTNTCEQNLGGSDCTLYTLSPVQAGGSSAQVAAASHRFSPYEHLRPYQGYNTRTLLKDA